MDHKQSHNSFINKDITNQLEEWDIWITNGEKGKHEI